MVPQFQKDGVSLYRGDALAVLSALSDNSVDAILTDPPYSSGGVTLGARQAEPSHKYQSSETKRQYPPMLGDAKDQRSWTMWCTLWLGECWRIARDGAPLMVFTDWRQLPALSDAVQAADWKWLGIIAWDKKSARPQIGKFRQQCEFVLFAVKGRFVAHTRSCLPGVYTYPVIATQKVHLTSKPVNLIKDLLAVTDEYGVAPCTDENLALLSGVTTTNANWGETDADLYNYLLIVDEHFAEDYTFAYVRSG